MGEATGRDGAAEQELQPESVITGSPTTTPVEYDGQVEHVGHVGHVEHVSGV